MDYSQMLRERIKYFRKLKKVTQTELEGKLGVSRRYIGSIENGHRKPSFDMLVILN